jgi:DNA-binding PadR family transcriptional regulator
MFETTSRDLESPATTEESHLTCSTCGQHVLAIETRGPGHHVAVPCGHRVAPTTRECVDADDRADLEDDLRTDGGTPRYKIAERVAAAVRETTEQQLRRRASDRLDADERQDLADWIEQRVTEDVNGALRKAAAEKHDHDLVPDGGRQRSRTTTSDRRWRDLTAFQRDMLEAIRRVEATNDTPYGLAIKSELEEMYDETVNHGQLYPNLDELVQADFVEKGQLDRRTNSYELSDAGRDLLRGRLHRLTEVCDVDRPVADGGESA